VDTGDTAVLIERGFVTSRYLVSEDQNTKGKALRLYTVTDKVTDVTAKLKKGR
jgi:hemolysin activation/secretion protein